MQDERYSKKPYVLFRQNKFEKVDLGAGFVYCKELPNSEDFESIVYISSDCECSHGDGTIKRIDERCNIYLDVRGITKKVEHTFDVVKAIDIANAWYQEYVEAA